MSLYIFAFNVCELFASIFLEKSKVRRGLGGSDHVEMNGYILNHSDPDDLSDTNSLMIKSQSRSCSSTNFKKLDVDLLYISITRVNTLVMG